MKNLIAKIKLLLNEHLKMNGEFTETSFTIKIRSGEYSVTIKKIK